MHSLKFWNSTVEIHMFTQVLTDHHEYNTLELTQICNSTMHSKVNGWPIQVK